MSESVGQTSGVRDNYSRGKAGEYISEHLCEESVLSIVSAYFTIHAYDALKHKLNRIGQLRFLFGDPESVSSLDRDIKDSKRFEFTEKGLQFTNQLLQRKLAAFCAKWIEKKAEIPSIILACTERVLNPAAHSGNPPLYEKEVQDARSLFKQLETITH